MAKKQEAQTETPKKKKGSYGGSSVKTWKFFDLDEYLALSTYSKGAALGVAPSHLQPYLLQPRPFATGSYKGKGAKYGTITSFKVKIEKPELALLAKKSGVALEILPVPFQSPQKDKDYNLNFIVENNLSGHEISKVKDMFRFDVSKFCNDIPAINKLDIAENFKFVDAIVPSPKFKPISVNEILIKGKGGYHIFCWLDWGFDLLQNCFATMLPDGTYDRKGRCTYCYAEYQNGKPATEGVKDISRKNLRKELGTKLVGEGPHYIRSGQRVENMIPAVMKSWDGFIDTLPLVLEEIAHARKEKRIAVAFPTKVLEYDTKLAKLLIDANVTLLASIGYEALEKNVVRLGSTTKARLEGLLQYAENGVRAVPYIMTDVTRSMDYLQDEAKLAVDFYEQHKDVLTGLQFLDARITKKRDAPIIAGANWDDLKEQHGQLNFFTIPRYHLTGNGYLAANFIHQDFLNLIGNNRGDTRMCYTHGSKKMQKCGACFMENERSEKSI